MSNDTVGIWLTVPEGEKERAQPIVRDLLRVTASKLKVFPQHGDEMRLLDALADSARLVKLEELENDCAARFRKLEMWAERPEEERACECWQDGADAAIAALKERLGVK